MGPSHSLAVNAADIHEWPAVLGEVPDRCGVIYRSACLLFMRAIMRSTSSGEPDLITKITIEHMFKYLNVPRNRTYRPCSSASRSLQ